MPKTVKGEPFGIFQHPLLQNIKKLKGDGPPLETSKIFEKQKMNFEQSRSAEKSERGDPLGFSNIHWVAKDQKHLKGESYGDI